MWRDIVPVLAVLIVVAMWIGPVPILIRLCITSLLVLALLFIQATDKE